MGVVSTLPIAGGGVSRSSSRRYIFSPSSSGIAAAQVWGHPGEECAGLPGSGTTEKVLHKLLQS